MQPELAAVDQELYGKIDININGLPQGARVDQKPAGDIPFNVNAGYRSDALGMAW